MSMRSLAVRPSGRLTVIAALVIAAAAPTAAQRPAAAISADTLRVRLFALADDSMGGRQTGEVGNVKAADWVAAAFRAYGLEPAGDNGTWFQVLPFVRTAPDPTSRLIAGRPLVPGVDFVPAAPPASWRGENVRTIAGGVMGDTTTYPSAADVEGKLVVFTPPAGMDFRSARATLNVVLRRHPRFVGAAGLVAAILDLTGTDLIDQMMAGGISATPPVVPAGKPALMVTSAAAAQLLAAGTVSGSVGWSQGPIAQPARNVVGILRGADPALRGTYVSLSAHNDHVGFTRAPVDHDSARAFNRVVRPMGADSRMRPATPDEAARIAAIRDSLRRAHAPRQDSIFNGADDDGSGTVALVELARVLSRGPRPRRSILFVSHAAEERGLLGSAWFTDHATVPVDSIVAEIDEDMIGRGNAADLPEGGPGYLEIVGARRLSREFGDTLEAVNRRQALPFTFNYAYDAPGHPLQYYCRADHYSYARYGIPSVALSRGEHLDYHQVTDEAQYIDYAALARVATLVRDAALALANMEHRPALDGPHGDPHAQCRQ